MEEARIRENVQQRELVDELMQLGTDLSKDFSDRQRFWWLLADEIAKQMFAAEDFLKQSGTMSDDEAKRFGRKPIPYGEFAGTRVDDVPLDRLCWYADQRWTDELRRYLKSKRIQAEIES